MAINPNTGLEDGNPVIKTEAMKQYNQKYNPNVGSGVSGIMGTPEKPTLSKQVAETNLNPSTTPVVTPQDTTVPVDSGNILAVRANQTPEEKAWQTKQDAFDQARTGVNPAPTQVEKTTTTTPEGQTVVKKETPGVVAPDYNVGKGREQEIAKNLQEGFANDPAIQKAILNGDRASFDMAYGYSESDPTKQKILDYFFKSRQPSSPDEYFNQMIQGISMNNPSLQKNPLFQKAKTRFNDLNINAGLTTNELSDKIRDGSINIGSQAYTDLQMKNPELIRKAEMLNSINTGKGNAKVDGNAVLTNVTENITKDVSKEDIPNYQKMLAGNTQVKDALAKKTETETKMNGLQDTLDNLEEDTRNDLKGKGKSEGYIQALISEKSKPIVRQLSTLGRTYSSQLANLQYYSDIVKEEYNTKKEERKTASDRAYETTKDTREFGQQKQLADYQAQLGLKTKQAEFEQQMAQKAQIANDPVLATQDVLDTYAKLGILPERSQSEIIQSVKNDIAGGMTLGQSLTNLNKAFQSKQQYKEKIAPKTEFTTFDNNLYKTDAQGNITLAMTGKAKPSDIKWTKLDDGMYQDAEGNIHTKQEMDQAKLFGNPLLNAKVGEDVGVECGQYARTATGLTATPGGNSLEKRKQAFSDTNATPGGLVLFDGGGYDKTYGHIAVVTGVSADGKTITVKESNYNGDNKVTERTIPTTYVSGYYNNTPLAQGGEESPTISDKQFTQFNQMYSKFQSDKGVQAFESALAGGGDLIASLKSANGPGDVGAVFGFMKSLDPASVVKEGEFQLAAKSAGVWEQFKNIPANKLEGAILTDDQRKAFGKLAFEYIKSKSKIYDIKYDDMAKILKNQNIPDSYMPTKMSDYIKEVEQGNKPETKTFTSSSGKTYNTNDYE